MFIARSAVECGAQRRFGFQFESEAALRAALQGASLNVATPTYSLAAV